MSLARSKPDGLRPEGATMDPTMLAGERLAGEWMVLWPMLAAWAGWGSAGIVVAVAAVVAMATLHEAEAARDERAATATTEYTPLVKVGDGVARPAPCPDDVVGVGTPAGASRPTVVGPRTNGLPVTGPWPARHLGQQAVV